MSHIMNTFLATEITCIPQVLDRYAGKYYSNTIGNGATWVFFMWHILHFIFEEGVNLLLKKMHTKEYVRVRLKQSIWYLGFYIASFAYCAITLYKSNTDIFGNTKILGMESDNVPGYFVLGSIILCTFYAHSIIWESLKKGFSIASVSYLFIDVFILLTYFCRKVELSLSLLAIVSLSHFGIELARCISTLLKHDSQVALCLIKIILYGAICLFVLTHLIIVPLFFLLPLGYSFILEPKTIGLTMLNITIWLWLLSELLNNPLYKLVIHWLYHDTITPKTKCPGTLAECCLFQPRDDVAFNLKIIREEIKERETKMISLRKPKNRSMLLQTLKCMVAIKKKLKDKKSSDSSDSEDSESEQKNSKGTRSNIGETDSIDVDDNDDDNEVELAVEESTMKMADEECETSLLLNENPYNESNNKDSISE